MKKILFLITAVCGMLMAGGAYCAEMPLGDAVKSEIVTYINHVPINSYNWNGRTLIAVEDLDCFGFDVYWNEYKRTLSLARNKEENVINVPVVVGPAAHEVGSKAFTVTTTDVSVYVGSYRIESFGGIDGYTFIDAEELVCFDNVSVAWIPEVKALKIWIEDGLEMYSYMLRPVPNFLYYDYDDAPSCNYYHEWHDEPTYFDLSVYMIADDGCYIDPERSRLTITDVIDADGKSVLKKQVTRTGVSLLPYVFGWSEGYLSSYVELYADDLYMKTASEDGGIIKYTYKSNGYNTDLNEVIRVEQLPYYKSY